MVTHPAEASQELRQLVAGFPSQRPGFEPGSDHVGFVADKVALGFSLQIFIPLIAPQSPSSIIWG
jgi:hypothetical protein